MLPGMGGEGGNRGFAASPSASHARSIREKRAKVYGSDFVSPSLMLPITSKINEDTARGSAGNVAGKIWSGRKERAPGEDAAMREGGKGGDEGEREVEEAGSRWEVSMEVDNSRRVGEEEDDVKRAESEGGNVGAAGQGVKAGRAKMRRSCRACKKATCTGKCLQRLGVRVRAVRMQQDGSGDESSGRGEDGCEGFGGQRVYRSQAVGAGGKIKAGGYPDKYSPYRFAPLRTPNSYLTCHVEGCQPAAFLKRGFFKKPVSCKECVCARGRVRVCARACLICLSARVLLNGTRTAGCNRITRPGSDRRWGSRGRTWCASPRFSSGKISPPPCGSLPTGNSPNRCMFVSFVCAESGGTGERGWG